MPRGKAQDPPPSSRERKTAAQQPARWAGELACSTPFSLPKISPTTAALITGDPTPLTPPPPTATILPFWTPKGSFLVFPSPTFFFLAPARCNHCLTRIPAQASPTPPIPQPPITGCPTTPPRPRHGPVGTPHAALAQGRQFDQGTVLPPAPLPRPPAAPIPTAGLTCSILSPCQHTYWSCTKTSGITLIMQQ